MDVDKRLRELKRSGMTWKEVSKKLREEKYTTTTGREITESWPQSRWNNILKAKRPLLKAVRKISKAKPEMITIPIEEPKADGKVFIMVTDAESARRLMDRWIA